MHPKKVLLVEADSDYSYLFRIAYRTANVSNPLQVLSSREQAIDYLKTASVGDSLALIILAMPLHLLYDFPLLRWIRGHSELSEVPVFVLSGQELPNEETKAHELGSDCYSEKPLSFDGLIKLIGTLRDRWLLRADPTQKLAH